MGVEGRQGRTGPEDGGEIVAMVHLIRALMRHYGHERWAGSLAELQIELRAGVPAGTLTMSAGSTPWTSLRGGSARPDF